MVQSLLSVLLLFVFSITLAHADVETVAAKIEQLRKDHGVAAVSLVLVDRDGLLLHRSTGVVDLKQRKPVDADTVFRVGSITKTFTGLALVRAEAKGLLRLDQPIRQLAPRASFENRWESSAPLTLAELLEHSAGWPDMSRAEFDSNDSRPLSLAEALALRPASRVSQWRPGEHSEYSNSGPGLAAWVLEQVVHQAFEAFAHAEVFKPLGMSSASLLPDAVTRTHLAQGYDRDGITPLPYWNVLYRPAAGLNLNPRDMAPLLRMLLNRGRVDGKIFLSPEQVSRLEHPRTTIAAHAGLDYGYGLGIYAEQHQGHTIYMHGGDADGYLSHYAYSLESGRGYFFVITAFQSDTENAMREVVEDWLVEGLPTAMAPPIVKLSPARLKELSGEYFAATTRFVSPQWQLQNLRVTVRNGQLITRGPDGDELELLAVDALRFRRPWETVATTIFVTQPDGRIVLQGPMGNWQRPARRDSSPPPFAAPDSHPPAVAPAAPAKPR